MISCFINQEKPLLTVMLQCETLEVAISRIRNSLHCGADGFGLQVEVLKSEYHQPEYYKKLFDDDLINDGFYTECFNGHWHSATLIEGESKDPYKVKEIIDEHIKQAKIDGLDKDAFERCKKASLGSLVSAFDEPSGIPRMMIDAAMSNEGVFDSIDIAKSITYEDVMNRFKEMFDIDNSSNESILLDFFYLMNF